MKSLIDEINRLSARVLELGNKLLEEQELNEILTHEKRQLKELYDGFKKESIQITNNLESQIGMLTKDNAALRAANDVLEKKLYEFEKEIEKYLLTSL